MHLCVIFIIYSQREPLSLFNVYYALILLYCESDMPDGIKK